MSRLSLLAAALILTAAASVEAQSDEHKLDSSALAAQAAVFTRQTAVKSGALATLVTLANDPKPDCTVPENTPALRLVRLPAHGALLLQSGSKTLQYPSQNPLAACNGRMGLAMYVVYRPDAGYQGTDRLEIAFEQNQGATKMAYDITVN